jgi:hypothetical protein
MPKRPNTRLAAWLAALLLTAACGTDVTTQASGPDPSPPTEEEPTHSPTTTPSDCGPDGPTCQNTPNNDSRETNPDPADNITVVGHLFDDGTGLVLCPELEAQGEGYDCGGDPLSITGINLSEIPSLVHLHGTSYTPEKITVVGERHDTTMTVSQLITR